MDIDLRHLRHARALAEHGHFGRAARSLGLTQPALSRSIAELERQAGTQLFDRRHSGIEPTDMGRLLLDRAAELLTRAVDLGREMASLQGRGAGALRVGAGTYPAAMVVGDALGALLRLHPDVEVRVVEDNVFNLVPLLRRRELDLVIGDVVAVAGDGEVQITPLASRQGYFVCRSGHPLLNVTPLRLVDILAVPLILASRNVSRRLAPFIAKARQSGSQVSSAPAVTCDSLEMMKTIAAVSDGVAILPLNFIATELAAGTLAVLPVVEPSVRVDFGIFRLTNRTPPPSAEAFMAFLTDADAAVTRQMAAIEKKLFGRPRQPRRPAARPGRPRRAT
jgi:DNA-binding transcriptional LysR family regulator